MATSVSGVYKISDMLTDDEVQQLTEAAEVFMNEYEDKEQIKVAAFERT